MAKRIDSNQHEIVTALRKAGCKVLSMAPLGKGSPDLLVCAPDGEIYLIEVKTDKGKLTPDQIKFHQEWPVEIVIDVLSALVVVGAV